MAIILAPSTTAASPSGDAVYDVNSGEWIEMCAGATLIIGWIDGTTYDTFPMSVLPTTGKPASDGSCSSRPTRAAFAAYSSSIGPLSFMSAYAGSFHSCVISQP